MSNLSNLPLFPVSLMGSWPRSATLLNAHRKFRKNLLNENELNNIIKSQTKTFVELQEKLKIDIITDGEFYRDNFCSFVADKINGAKLMAMSEMLDYVENKEMFEDILEALSLPASSIKNAICTGKLSCCKGIILDEFRLLKTFTKKPIKMTLPGPYILARSMWLPSLSKHYYTNKEKLGDAVVKILCNEIDRLAKEEIQIIQLDEPVLTEVVFTQGRPRSFMCGALASRKDPTEELEFASFLIQKVVKHINSNKIKSCVHVCRGNYSCDESTLLTGSYIPLINVFEKIQVNQLSLEFSTPRAGEIASLFSNNNFQENIQLGLGVINPRIPHIETENFIIKKVEEALRFLPKENIWLNPDCGFATFANSPLNSKKIAIEKINIMVKASTTLRQKYA